MSGNYAKSVYNQLVEVMEKLDSMEAEHKRPQGNRGPYLRSENEKPAQRECLSQEGSIRPAAENSCPGSGKPQTGKRKQPSA